MRAPIVYFANAQNDTSLFTLGDLCERSGIHAEIVVEMIEFGIVAPIENHAENRWQFNIQALMRLNRAQRLKRDLELNLPGLALALELLDEIEKLQQQVTSLKFQLRRPRDGWAWHTQT